jgi:hypothetical protein
VPKKKLETVIKALGARQRKDRSLKKPAIKPTILHIVCRLDSDLCQSFKARALDLGITHNAEFEVRDVLEEDIKRACYTDPALRQISPKTTAITGRFAHLLKLWVPNPVLRRVTVIEEDEQTVTPVGNHDKQTMGGHSKSNGAEKESGIENRNRDESSGSSGKGREGDSQSSKGGENANDNSGSNSAAAGEKRKNSDSGDGFGVDDDDDEDENKAKRIRLLDVDGPGAVSEVESKMSVQILDKNQWVLSRETRDLKNQFRTITITITINWCVISIWSTRQHKPKKIIEFAYFSPTIH